MIYYNSKQASGKIYNLSRANKIMYGLTEIYPDYIKPEPPTPTGDFKWKATYRDGTTASAECDSTSAIIENEIPDKANVVSVEIGDCVTSIDYKAFYYYYTMLTSVTIPNTVTSIGQNAFNNCIGLTSVIIPDSVTSVDTQAFMYCRGLTSIIVEATTPPTLGVQVFLVTNDCPIYVPASSVDAYKSANNWSLYKSRIFPIQ